MKHLYLLMNYWKWEWKLISGAWLFEAIYKVHEILQARILESIAFPFSRGSSQPRDRTQVSHITGGFFTSWAIREALMNYCMILKNDKWMPDYRAPRPSLFSTPAGEGHPGLGHIQG